MLSPSLLGAHSSSSSTQVMDKPNTLAAGRRLQGFCCLRLCAPKGSHVDGKAHPVSLQHACFMARIHTCCLSPSTRVAALQLSSSGAGLFSLQSLFAVALQKALSARQVVCDVKPIKKAPGLCFWHLVVFFSNHRVFRPANKPQRAHTERALAAASR